RNYGTLQWLGADGNVKQKIPLKFKDSGHGASGINTMAADGDTLYVAGGFFSMNDLEREYAAALRISTGEILRWKPRVNNFVHSIVVSNTAVFMSGSFDTVSGSYQKRIARVSKGQGELQPWPKPIPDRLTNHFSFYINKKILLWKDQLFTVNGSMNIETAEEGIWKPSPLLLEKPGDPFFIADMAIVGGVIYTVGSFSSMNDEPRNGMAAFSAENGKVLPWNPNKGWQPTVREATPTVHSIQVVDTIAYCAGSINNIGGIPVRGIGAVATTTGQLLPWNPSLPNYTRLFMNITAYLVPPRFLGASEGGVLMTISGIGTIGQPLTARSGIAEVDLRTGALSPWDPGFRSRMQSDPFYVPYTHIHVLALQGSTLYVGGVFDSVGGVPRSRLCAFDATTHRTPPLEPIGRQW
ncbi:MAG: transmembrane protein, partial [Chlorobi bacterium OLB7]